jgi:hypothetical protein
MSLNDAKIFIDSVRVLLCPLLCLKVLRFRPLVLLIGVVITLRRVSSICGMILTGDNRSVRRKTCPSATLSTTSLTWTELGSNLNLSGEKPATNRLSHGTAVI